MGIETIAALGGSALSSFMGARSQERAGNRDRQYQMAQQERLRNLLMPYLDQTNKAGSAERQLEALMPRFGQQGPSFTPERVSSTSVGGPDRDFIFGGEGFNTGQDALMQMLRADPSGKIPELDANLGSLLETGGRFDTSDLMSSLDQSNQIGQQDALTQLRGGFGSLGRRFGTGAQQAESDLLRRLTSDAATQRAGILQGSFENAQGRRLQAGQLLGGLEGARAGQRLSAIGLQNDQTGQRLGAEQMALQAALANQAASGRAGEFNAGMGLDAFNANSTNRLNSQQQLLQALGMLGGMGQGRQESQAQLLSLLFGQQPPGANPATGAGYNALSEIGQTAALLPFMNNMFNRRPGA